MDSVQLFFHSVIPPCFHNVTVTKTSSACLCDFHVGRTNPGTFGVVLTSSSSGHCGSSILLTYSISDSKSATESCSLLFGLSKSPFQISQTSVSEMLSGALFSSLSTGLGLILQNRQTLNIWVRPPGRSLQPKLVAMEIFLTI
jgi:hypothetical protein